MDTQGSRERSYKLHTKSRISLAQTPRADSPSDNRPKSRSSNHRNNRQSTRKNHNSSPYTDIKDPSPTNDLESRSRSTGDSLELQPSNYKKLYDKYWGAFTNLGYINDRDEEQGRAIELLLTNIWENAETLEENLRSWEKYSQELTENRSSIHTQIDERKIEFLKQVEAYSDSLHERVDGMLCPRVDNSQVVTTDMISVLRDMQNTTGSPLEGAKDATGVRRELERLSTRIDQANVEPPDWAAVSLLVTNRSNQLVGSVFGALDGGTSGPGWLSGLSTPRAAGPTRLIKVQCKEQSTDSLEDDGESGDSEFNFKLADSLENLDTPPSRTSDSPVAHEQDVTLATKSKKELLVEPELLAQPEILSQFSCKTSKDSREMGIVDVAMTPQHDIIVVDKHNKLVKVFSQKGKFIKFIGHKFLREPSRVSVLRTTGQILVTDYGTKNIKIFHRDGGYIGEFASDLKNPVCHCETYDQKIAVLEFATKSILLYDESGRAVHSFATDLECPAYLGCTRNGNIVVTDWRASIVKVYDVTGQVVIVCNHDNQGVDRPHGVCGDLHGNILVAQKGDHCVKILTEDGNLITQFTETDFQLKIPMGITHNGYELLVTAGYTGSVKVVRYIDLPYQKLGATHLKAPSGGKRRKSKKHRPRDTELVDCNELGDGLEDRNDDTRC